MVMMKNFTENLEEKKEKATQEELKLINILIGLHEKYKFNDVQYDVSIETSERTILVCTGKIGNLIGKQGTIIKELPKKNNKPVRIIEKSKDVKKMAQDLLGNTPVDSANKIYSTEGEQNKIIISQKMPETKISELENILEKILETKTKIEINTK